MKKRLIPYLRTTRTNPTGHFWFTKIPAGRYYIVSLIEGGSGAHQHEQLAELAWLVIELDAGEKVANLVVTDCKAPPLLSLIKQPGLFFILIPGTEGWDSFTCRPPFFSTARELSSSHTITEQNRATSLPK